MEILGLEGVVVWANDLGRAAAFYGLVLEMEEGGRAEGSVQFHAGLSRIVLKDWPLAYGGLPFLSPAEGGASPVLEVDDILRLHRNLEEAGAEVLAPPSLDGEGMLRLTFRDTEGNTLIACQPRALGQGVLLAEAEMDEGDGLSSSGEI